MNRSNKREGTAVSLTSMDPEADFKYKQTKSLKTKVYTDPLIPKED